LRECLVRGACDEAAAQATDAKRGLGILVSLTSHPDPTIGWRAVRAIGLAAERVAERNEERIRNELRRLHWMLNDESGNIGWRAPQAMAEIVRREPRRFSEYLPIVVHLIENVDGDEMIRAGLLWAVGRLAPLARTEVEAVLPKLIACLDDPSAEIRGLAAWCLGEAGLSASLRGREQLLRDASPLAFFEEGEIRELTVGELARKALG
jgi:HEAT repeat protein